MRNAHGKGLADAPSAVPARDDQVGVECARRIRHHSIGFAVCDFALVDTEQFRVRKQGVEVALGDKRLPVGKRSISASRKRLFRNLASNGAA